MGALPKRKTSKARRDKRHSHSGVKPPALNTCPQCHSTKLPHHVCPTCGHYAGREVIEAETLKPQTG
jgi:large subunit ribosomal protein L32